MIKDALMFLLPRAFKIGRKKYDLLSTETTAADNETLRTMQDMVKVWCLENRFLIPTSTDKKVLIPNVSRNDLSLRLQNHLYLVNLKRLNHREIYEETLQVMRDTASDSTTSRLIDLHIQICLELDPRWLNLYINKLLHLLISLSPNDAEDIAWRTIFDDYPYLWLLWPIQQTMRFHAPAP